MKRAVLSSILMAISLHIVLSGQQLTSGKNVNVAGGPAILDERGVPTMGDPYLQRQNEPSMACSSRNPLNCLAGANDYRRLDFPGTADGKVTGDAWLGAFWTRDGGHTWRSALVPGYAEDLDPLGQASPAHQFEAAADPVVRPGTNGLFYYSGIAFNRAAIGTNTSGAEGKDGVMFVSRFIDDNNTQTIDTPFRYLGASAVAYSNSAKFLDKPGLAVDIPRTGSGVCTIPGQGEIPAQSFPGGAVYVAYAAFMGADDNVHTKIQFHRSTDCGQTWSSATMLSEASKINQSPSIAIEPESGRVYVAWREFGSDMNDDRILVAVSTDLGKTFKKGVVAGPLSSSTGTPTGFDQPTLPNPLEDQFRLFRTNSYPTICVAGDNTAYLAWAQRGLGPLGEARIVYSTSADGSAWSAPQAIDPLHDGQPYNGHQFMPALACAGDKITAIWYDQRADAIADVLAPESAFAPFLLDTRALTIPTRTLDVRAAHATVGQPFASSVPVTRYPLGVYMQGEAPATLQLQYSLENLPLFAGGVVPFIGDYIDVAPGSLFEPVTAGGGQTGSTAGVSFKNQRRGAKAAATEPNGWVFNTSREGTPPFHAIWTDNRDVVAATPQGPIDQTSPPCTPGNQAGSKNQNVYTSRLSTGLVAGVFGNARPLGADLRAFSVFVQNLTRELKTVELRIANQPLGGGTASFIQFPPDPEDPRFPFPLVALVGDFAPKIPPFSAIARTVFVSGSGNSPIRVDVDEIINVGGTTVVGQQLFAMINPDPSNPAPLDPELRGAFSETHDAFIALSSIEDYDLTNPNFLNPTFLNPTFLNPNFLNPNFLNPNFLNPTFLNPNFLNPNFLNPNFLNPNFLNPNFLNPTFLNPTFLNPTFLNTTMTEISWDVDAEGNTSSTYLLALLASMDFPPSWQSQLLIYRVYLSPASGYDPSTGGFNCGELGTSEQHDLLTDVLNPNFLNPNFLNTVDFSNPNFLNTALSAADNNPTFSLSSGDRAKVVLRVAHDGTFQPSFVTAVVIPGAVDTEDAAAGITTPTISPAPLVFAAGPQRPAGVVGMPYSDVLAITGGMAPFTWADVTLPCIECPTIPPGIPPGLTLNTATGQISGTPTQSGSRTFQIRVTDSSSPAQTVTATFAIEVNDPLVIETGELPVIAPGQPLDHMLTSTGGRDPITWSLVSGTLPAGISLDTTTGRLSGTTTAVGDHSFTVRATDSATPVQTDDQPLTLTVADQSLVIDFVPQPATVTAGEPFDVIVDVRDQSGAVIPGAQLSLALGNNPTGATLTGGGPVTTNETGQAQFIGVRISRGGWNVTLRAQAEFVGFPVTLGDSDPFTVVGFAPAAGMAQPRVIHTATLLADGQVLVAGGFAVEPTEADVFLTSAELFKPGGTTGGFSATGNLNLARGNHTATLLPDGRVLIVGGQTELGGETVATPTVELYDPDGGVFVAGPSLETARFLHTATLLADGRVVVAGGDATNGDPLSSTEIFDPASNEWTPGPPMSVVRSAHTATLLPSRLILFAGGRSDPDEVLGHLPTASFEAWDPVDGPQTLPSNTMKVQRAHHTATLLPNGQVVIAGGDMGNGQGSNNVLDVITVAPFGHTTLTHGVARHLHTATWLQTGQVLLAGGRLQQPVTSDDPSIVLQHAELANGLEFTPTHSMETPRQGHAATRLLDGRVLVTGGDNGQQTTLASSELFYPTQTGGFVDGAVQASVESADVHVGHENEQSVAQSIRASLNGRFSLLDMPAGCTNGETLTIQLVATDLNGAPTDQVLRSQDFVSPAGYQPGQLSTFVFSDPLDLVPGMQFAIVAKAAPGSLCYWRNGSAGDPYPPGSGFSKIGAQSWVPSDADRNDMAFQVVIR